MLEAELPNRAKLHKKSKEYKIDQLLQKHGHDVLRLPSFYCHFNIIEMFWAQTKFTLINIFVHLVKVMKKLDLKSSSVNMYSVRMEKKVQHTEKIIEEWYKQEKIIILEFTSITKIVTVMMTLV